MNLTLKKLVELQELTRQSEEEEHPSGLQKKIEFLRTGLPEQILRRFDHLTKFHKQAVAPISSSGACGSCHMKLPPADALRIRSSSDQLVTCPFCECFLYSTAALFDEPKPTET
jgi:predicted  nucleic acid-binding Zn-ribbon protein